MKIAYVSNEYPPALHGGIGTFVHTIAHAMRRASHAVTVVGLGDCDNSWDDDGVRVVTLARSRVLRVGSLHDRLKIFAWLRREARAGRIDCIELPDFQGMLPLSFKACPTVVRLHLTNTAILREAGQPVGTATYQCELRTLRHHPRWIAVSRHILDLTKATFRLNPARSEVIYNPVTLPDAAEGASPVIREPFVLFAGTVCRRKGAYLLAEAARRFLHDFPDTHLVYAGPIRMENGVSSDERIRRILGAEFDDRLHILGQLSRSVLMGWMGKATVFAFPSMLEAMPLVPAEAMLSGVPVVVSDAGPFPEIVKDNSTGLLVPAQADALAEAISQLLGSPELRRTLGERGRRDIAERFSVDACARATESFYDAAVTEWRLRR